MIIINSTLALADTEITLTFIRSGGPGGQNVNKVSTAVQLRFDARHSPSLPQAVRARLERIAGTKLTKEGEIVITANRFRTQPQNREDAIARLVEMIQRAAFQPKSRVATRPTYASTKRRMATKAKRGEIKRLRGVAPTPED